MEIITLKSNINRYKHLLYPLKSLSSDTIAYKYYTEYPPKILRNKVGNINGIEFHCGPTLMFGVEDYQCHKILKEISPAFRQNGQAREYLFDVLIFE